MSAPRVCSECDQPTLPSPRAKTCSLKCAKRRHRRRRMEHYDKHGVAEVRPEPRRRLGFRLPLVAGKPYPIPIQIPSVLDPDPDRETWCAHYDDCLDAAIRQDWPSWDCSECPIRGTCDRKPRPDEIARSSSSLLTMIEAADPHPSWNRKERRLNESAGPPGDGVRAFRRAEITKAEAAKKRRALI